MTHILRLPATLLWVMFLAGFSFSLMVPAANAQQIDHDFRNPRYFVRISECAVSANVCKEREILSASAQEIVERVNTEVDRRSKIFIRFDKDLLKQYLEPGTGFKADISITGKIGSRTIEIPGYSVIGEDARSSSFQINIVAARAMLRMLVDAEARFSRLRGSEALDFLRSLNASELVREGSNSTDINEDEIERIGELTSKVSSLVFDTTGVYQQYRALQAEKRQSERIRQLFPGNTRPDTLSRDWNTMTERVSGLVDIDVSSISVENLEDLVQREIKDLEKQLSNSRNEIQTLSDERDSLRQEITGDAEKQRLELNEARRRVEQTVRTLGNIRPGLLELLTAIVDERNGTALLDVMEGVPTAPSSQLFRSTIRDLETHVRAVPGRIDWTSRLAITELLEHLQAIWSVDPFFIKGRDQQQAVDSELKSLGLSRVLETELVLNGSAIDARKGDVLEITIANTSPGQAIPRTYTARIHIREFGLTKRVLDSFLFVKRLDVPGSPETDFISRFMVRSPVVSTDGTTRTTVFEYPASVNFEATPGATLLWNWGVRKSEKSNGIGRVMRGLVRFLDPSIGINVSFPSFGTTTLTRTDRLDANGNVRPGQTTTERTNVAGDIDIASGVLVGLFDGGVNVSWGQNLSVHNRRTYFAIGFSFTNIAGRIGTGAD